MVENDHTVITNRIEILDKDRIRQGDILKCNEWSYWDKEYEFPYIYVLTQDCDLSQDYRFFWDTSLNDDKILENILVCPLFFFLDFANGTHIKYKKEWDGKVTIKNMLPKVKREQEKIEKNELDRYFCIKEYKTWGNTIIPEIVMDFKFFITIPREEIYLSYKKNYVCSISEVFREDISRRFANFLSRIWLPELKEE